MWREVWGKVRGDVGYVKKRGGRCRKVYGVSVECVSKCVGVWGDRKKCEGCGEVWGEVCWGFPNLPAHFPISPFTSP